MQNRQKLSPQNGLATGLHARRSDIEREQMGHDEVRPSLHRRSLSFDDFDDSLFGVEGRTILTAPEEAVWRSDLLSIDGLGLQVVQEGGPNSYDGAATAGCVSLAVGLRAPTFLRLGGAGLSAGWMAIVRPGDPVVSHCSAINRWASLVMPIERFLESANRLDPTQTDHLFSRPSSIRIRLEDWEKIVMLIERVMGVATRQDISLNCTAMQAAAEELTTRFICAAINATDAPRRLGRPALSRTRIATHVREWLESPTDELTSIAKMSEYAGVSERTLRNVCVEHFGLTPKRLLLLRQLHTARADILQASPGETVSRIAARHGIWDFGRFALRYRAVFGESPSETLRRQHR